MSTIAPQTSDTSVTFSLAELAKLEEERVRHEDAQRAQARARTAQAQRDVESSRRAAEAAHLASEEEARARRVRAEAEEKVRVEARARAAADVARIEAEARTRLDADNAERAHELAVLQARSQRGGDRLRQALAAALCLALTGGSVAAYGMTRHVAALEQDTGRIRDAEQALAKERDHAKATELAALDRRFALLRARPLARDAEEARSTVEAARNAVDPAAPDHGRLRAFGDALDGLQTRLETLEKLAALDRRRDDLLAWATAVRRSEATTATRTAAARARATGDESTLRSYEGALDQLRQALAQPAVAPGRTQLAPHTDEGHAPCADNDPMCGLNGRRL